MCYKDCVVIVSHPDQRIISIRVRYLNNLYLNFNTDLFPIASGTLNFFISVFGGCVFFSHLHHICILFDYLHHDTVKIFC